MNPQLQRQGYIILKGKHVLRDQLLALRNEALNTFYQTWNDLPHDPYLCGDSDYRQRRYSVFHYH